MIPLEHASALTGLGDAAIEALRSAARERQVRAGTTVLRRGVSGTELLVVAAGGVRVDCGPERAPLFLGPGEVLGEASLLAGTPISANVIADRDTRFWVVPGDRLLALVVEHPELRSALTDLLVQRRANDMAARTAPAPQVVLIEELEDATLSSEWTRVLRSAVARHVEDVTLIELGDDPNGEHEVKSWRRGAAPGAILLVHVESSALAGLRHVVERGDAVLRSSSDVERGATLQITRWGLADHAGVRVAGPNRAPRGERWAFSVVRDEIAGTASSTPALDRLARWIARRQVGIALGAGAARGFAHLGVLAELESLGIPVDRIAGTSMGGIAALLYGLGGDGAGGIENGAKTLGKAGARRVHWWPRSSFLSDRELRRRAAEVAEGRSFADLPLPVSVVATDLVAGERVVIERGAVDEAFFVTSAVPGALPPVVDGDRVLVDGALVSRIPFDLLSPDRCALRIAVNVIPSPDERDGARQRSARDLRRAMGRWLGMRSVLGRSWELLGWWHGERDAAGADVLIEPRTGNFDGYDFANVWRPMVDAGRAAIRERADELRTLAEDRLGRVAVEK